MSLSKEINDRREWIREQLKSGKLKGKPIIYYKELGEPSHATALNYLINKYDWGQGATGNSNNSQSNLNIEKQPLTDVEKQSILELKEKGHIFRINEFSDVDKEFVEFLKEIGATYFISNSKNTLNTKLNKQEIKIPVFEQVSLGDLRFANTKDKETIEKLKKENEKYGKLDSNDEMQLPPYGSIVYEIVNEKNKLVVKKLGFMSDNDASANNTDFNYTKEKESITGISFKNYQEESDTFKTLYFEAPTTDTTFSSPREFTNRNNANNILSEEEFNNLDTQLQQDILEQIKLNCK